MPHLPDDDYFARPLKVLRKRINGVYREDLGFSGPTRRYVVMVALLVALASFPTLAILTTGSSEITDDGRPGAMDVPFLPPPATGPVNPTTIQGYGEKPPRPHQLPSANPGGVPEPPSVAPTPSASRAPAVPPSRAATPPSRGAASPSRATVPVPRASLSAAPVPRRVTPPPAPRSRHTARSFVPRRAASPLPTRTSHRALPLPGPRRASFGSGPIPVVPDLPVVPEEDESPEPELPRDFPTVPSLPDIPDETGRAADDDSHKPEEPHEPDKPGKRDCEKAVNDRRSVDRPRHSRRSAVAERPYNVRPSRILEQSHTDGNLNVVRRLLTETNSEENRRANRPYRGMHRAEHTNYPEERSASYDRSTRVGRHHADPSADAHHINRR